MCELANGQVITPGTLIPWLGTAELETVLFDGPTTVISVSKRRRFTGACAGRSRCGTGTVSTPRAVTNRPSVATSTTPFRRQRTDRPVQWSDQVLAPQPGRQNA
jgi:hypothetical protein